MDNNAQVVGIKSKKFKYICYYAILARGLDIVVVFGSHITGREFLIDWSYGANLTEARGIVDDFEAGKYGTCKDFNREYAFEILDVLKDDELEEYFGTTDLEKIKAMLQAEIDLVGI